MIRIHRVAWPKPQFKGATRMLVGELFVVIGRTTLLISAVQYIKKNVN